MSDSAIPKGFVRVDRPGYSLILVDGCPSPLLTFLDAPPDQWESHPETVSYAGKGRHFSMPLPGDLGRGFVRRWMHGGGVRWLGRWFAGPDRAIREIEALSRARAAGVPVPEPLALRIDPGPMGCRLTTLTREVKADGDLPSVLGSFRAPLSAFRRRLARRLGAAVGTLHRSGVFPADLHLRNVLVTRTGDTPEVHLVDLDPVLLGEAGAVSQSGPAGDTLARLLRSCRRWTLAGLRIDRTDHARFFRSYADAAGFSREDRRRLAAWVLASPSGRTGRRPRDARGVTVRGGAITEPPSRVLVRMPNWLGDAVMAMPLLEGLRLAWPRADVTVLTKGNLSALYDLSPVPVETVSWDGESGSEGPPRRCSADLVLSVPRSLGAAWKAFRCGVASRVGFDGLFRGLLYTHRVHTNGTPAGRHRVETYWSLGAPFGLGPFPPVPRLLVPGAARAAADSLLDSAGVGPGEVLLGLNPGAAYGPAKQWPTDRFAEAARDLVRPGGRRILLFGSAAEVPLAEAIAREAGPAAVSLAGRTTLSILAALIARCRAFVTNDSGPMHLAAALQVPVIALFGSTDPVVTGPYGPGHRVIRVATGCSPCLLRRCPIDFRCMRRIPVARVVEAVERMIA